MAAVIASLVPVAIIGAIHVRFSLSGTYVRWSDEKGLEL